MLEELETDKISDPTKNQNDEIIIDQPVIRSETTQIKNIHFHCIVVVELLDNRIVIWELEMHL